MSTQRSKPLRHRSQNHRLSHRRGLFFESLEIRRVLDASALLSPAGTLSIEGTEDADRVVGFVRGRELCFEINGANVCFNNSRVRNIRINALGGDDHVELRPSVRQTAFLQGGDGNDTLLAGSGRTSALGGAGADTIHGGPQADRLRGGADNDVIHGGGGNDIIRGDEGSDYLEGGDGNDQMNGGGSTDVMFGGTGNDTMFGEDGDDYLVGGSGSDFMDGGAGNDWLWGDATNSYPEDYTDPVQYTLDFVNVNRGHDVMYGGTGNDIMLGGNGNDFIRGDDGDDAIVGGAGDDTLAGANGNDIILGDWRFETDGTDTAATDRLAHLAEPARSAIYAHRHAKETDSVDVARPTFNDNIYGGAGDDLLLGMQGSDTIYGDADIITSTASGVSTDDERVEAATLDAAGVTSFTATALVEPVPLPEPSFNDVIIGGSGDDHLYGEQGHDQMFGGAGNDSMLGGAGSDWMEGDAGNDRMHGGRHGDVMFGGAGDDTLEGGHGGDYLIGGSGNDNVSGGAGDDWLWGDATNNYPTGYTDPVQYSLDFMDTNRGEDFLDGGEGADVLLAGNGNDTAVGGAGSDVILGGRGNDRIGGDGPDRGGAADLILGDTIFRLTDVDVETRDKVRAVSAVAELLLVRDVAVEPVDPGSADPPPEHTYNDTIAAGAGNDVVFGQLGNDRISGGEGADLLVGGQGNDELRGGEGLDVLDGGAGNDRLFGGDGTDVLIGGTGEDYLDGGAGRDYIFARDGFIDVLCIDDLDFVDADDDDLLACEGEL